MMTNSDGGNGSYQSLTEGGENYALGSQNCGCEPVPNTDPTAVADGDPTPFTTLEDTAVTIDVLANDSDPDGHPIFITDVSQGSNGKVTFTANDVTYTPDENWHGSDSFNYTIKDGHGGSATASVQVTVNWVEDDPIAREEFKVVGEGGAVTVNLIENDTDAEGAVTIDWIDSYSLLGGIVTDIGNGSATYDNWMPYQGGGYSVGTGWESFEYRIIDLAGRTAVGQVEIYVVPDTPDDEWPITRTDYATTAEDTTAIINLVGNDWDDSGSLTITSLWTEQPGSSAVDNGDGTVTYTPSANFFGTDYVYYEVTDSIGQTNQAYAMVNVTPVNDSPVANDDPDDPNVPIPVWAGASVIVYNLANDTDVEVEASQQNQSLIVTDVTQGAKGKVIFDKTSVTYVPHPDASGADSFTYTVKDGHGGSDTATVYVDIILADLDVATIYDNVQTGWLPEHLELCEGAWLLLNDDDDDYDDENLPDMSQTGPIEFEDDLLPIVLRPIQKSSGPTGIYTLTFPSNLVRVWQNPDRTGEVTEAMEFDADTETTLYVEGIAEGNGYIELNWSSGIDPFLNPGRVVARFRFEGFPISGPENVPGHGTYEYAVRLPEASAPNPIGGGVTGFLTSANGTNGVSSRVPNNGWVTDTIAINWNNVATIGKVTYLAAPGYAWTKKVNIVQVDVNIAGSAAQYPGVPLQQGAGSAFIASAPAPDAMTAQITISTITGPVVNGSMRGVKFIDVGLVHQAQYFAKKGVYQNVNRERRSSLQDGQVHWDAGAANTLPWVFKNANHHFDAPADQTYNNINFSTFDTPIISATDQFVLNVNGVNDQVDVLGIDMRHWLYVAVHTSDARNGASEVYTQRAKLEWKFDGTGNVNGAGVWTLTGTGVTGDPKFTVVPSGTRIPNAAANLTEALGNQVWTTVVP